MKEEVNELVAIEKERMKYTILAGNLPLYQELYKEDPDVPDDSEIEWFRPESAEDFEAILSVLEAGERGQEDL